jgi:hypothetical protein
MALFSNMDDDEMDECNITFQDTNSSTRRLIDVASTDDANIDFMGKVFSSNLHIKCSYVEERWESLIDVCNYPEEYFPKCQNGLGLRVVFLKLLRDLAANDIQSNSKLDEIYNKCCSDRLYSLPLNFKTFPSGLLGRMTGSLSGSSQPTHYSYDADDVRILANLQADKTLEESELDLDFLDIFTTLYCFGIRVIYNLLPDRDSYRSIPMIQHVWENHFVSTTYVRAAQGIPIQVEVY